MKPGILFAAQPITRALLPAIVVLLGAVFSFGQRTKPVPTGDWGGTGIAMTITDSGGSIQFDCADGNITRQLRMKKDGSFAAAGTLTSNGPGPVRADRIPVGRPVMFKGKVEGKMIHLTMTDAKTGEKLGDYTAKHGQEPRLHRCL